MDTCGGRSARPRNLGRERGEGLKVKILSDITSWKNYRNLEAGKVYEIPPEDAQKLVQGGQAAEVIEEFLGEGVRKRVEAEAKRPTLADYLPEEATPPKPEEKPKLEEKRAEIDSELAGWLSSKGFTLGPEGVAFTRTERLETGDVVKLQVDFSDTPKGTRYGYRLDLNRDPPEWKSDRALHDHPLLLQFKRFRDDLLAQREGAIVAPKAVPPKAKSAEVPTGEGTTLALLPPGEAEAAEVERKDEAQIVTELKGEIKARVLSEYFYDFTHQGRRIVGLSYAGVKAIVRKLGSIKVLDLKVEEKSDSWVVIAKARDERRNLEAYGPGWQAKRIRLRNGQLVDDPFALQKAVGKAQRNAFRHFIEEKIIAEAYRAWLEERGGGGEK